MESILPAATGLTACPGALLAQGFTTTWWWTALPGIVFAFCFGACVGSFLNVVIYRLPAGISIISPPSRCPTCGARLTWKENFPILGWLVLRGRCRHCDVRISPQYVLMELFVAILFVALTIIFFQINPRTPYWGEIAPGWWWWNGIKTLPGFIAILIMFSGLIAMTVIDARTFTIPIQIPMWVTIVAFIAWPVQALISTNAWGGVSWPIPEVDWCWLWTSVGGMLGIAISLVLLRAGVFRYSFHDYEEYIKDDEPLADYPHARREMLVELLFLLPCLVLMVAGFLIGKTFTVSPPTILIAIGSSFTGYLVGGGIVWGIRILGSLAFGREAMGMGDVHLLAAVGATIGWIDPIFIFFTAAFVGLAWVALSLLLSAFVKKIQRELPYGPHLAVATLVVLFLHPVLYSPTGVWNYITTALRNLWPWMFTC